MQKLLLRIIRRTGSGAIAGLFSGAISGIIAGLLGSFVKGVSLGIAPSSDIWVISFAIFGVLIGTAAGIAIGAVVGIIDVKSNSALEWVIIVGVGSGLGATLQFGIIIETAVFIIIGVSIGGFVGRTIKAASRFANARERVSFKVLVGYFIVLVWIVGTTSSLIESYLISID